MLKRIGFSFWYFATWMIMAAVLGELLGRHDWLITGTIGAIGAFFGFFVGYGVGKDFS